MDKTLYTIIVHSENIAGLLNQVTAVFTRRQINIEIDLCWGMRDLYLQHAENFIFLIVHV